MSSSDDQRSRVADIFSHPGNLGPARGSLLTIHHADWPAYPQGEDFHESLLQLTAFPAGTRFKVIDDIDQSFLLVANRGRGFRPFEASSFHIAIWYDDLKRMGEEGFIEGIDAVSERRWVQEHWLSLRRKAGGDNAEVFLIGPNGERLPVKEPNLEDYDDEISSFVVAQHHGQLAVTEKGRQYLVDSLKGRVADIPSAFGERVPQIFKLGLYDSAVREACVQLESEMKAYVGSDKYGAELAKQFADKLSAENKLLESFLRTFHHETRTFFTYIRNDVMHNIRDADELSARIMLFRISRVRSLLNEVCGCPSRVSTEVT